MPATTARSFGTPLNTAPGVGHRYTLWRLRWSSPNPHTVNPHTALTSRSRNHSYVHTNGRSKTCSTPHLYTAVPLSALRQRLQPLQPSTPHPRAAPSGVDTTSDSRRPAVPHTARPGDAGLLRQYHRIAHIVSSRRAMNSERGGGSKARRILGHGPGGFSHNTGLCRGVYKHISRIAHPDKNLIGNAYYCAVAGIAMEAARRASDIVASPSSSDRDAFSLVPALDSAQFSALVDSHRQAKQGRTPLVRSATTAPPCGSRSRTPSDWYGTTPLQRAPNQVPSFAKPNGAMLVGVPHAPGDKCLPGHDSS